MPELPEVETIRRSLEQYVVGRQVERVTVRDRRLRTPVPTATLRRLLCGRRILGARRRAKYLLIDFEADVVLMIHLGMSGRLSVMPHDDSIKKHDHVQFLFDDGRQLRFNDPRRFGLIDAFMRSAESHHPRLVHLGMEPLGDRLDCRALHASTRRKKQTIKSYLLDGRRIVGVGNIYACEALYLAGVRPSRRVGQLSLAAWEKLVRAIQTTLRAAVAQGGTTLRDFADVDGSAGEFAVELRVYGRQGQPCVECSSPIRRVVQSGRSSFYCSTCQR